MDAVLVVGNLADEGVVLASNGEAFGVDILWEAGGLGVQLGAQAVKYDII